eukprot:TRINITY_DN4614_c0_g1_i1.p1 TRINITY_DN4614_c0_g1~~TRINITY_DN4614_c0_g1_i1.p1  ORF type:complete len:327 (-),score=64.42 TRINITY_DN4614_c0_g1_i1:2308-3174(-)
MEGKAVVVVKVMDAQNVPQRKSTYIRVSSASSKKFKTSYNYLDTSCPEWNEQFIFYIDNSESDMILFELKASSQWKKNEVMGECVLNLSEYDFGKHELFLPRTISKYMEDTILESEGTTLDNKYTTEGKRTAMEGKAVVVVKVMDAQNVPQRKSTYIRVSSASSKKFKTSYNYLDTSCPEWNEQFIFYIDNSESDMILFELKASSQWKKNEVMGECVLNLSEYDFGKHELFLPILSSSEHVSRMANDMEIHVILEIEAVDAFGPDARNGKLRPMQVRFEKPHYFPVCC